MVNVQLDCPVAGCGYSTGDKDLAAAVVLLQIHGTIHGAVAAGAAVPPAQQPAKIKCDPPKITAGSSEEQWQDFKRLWDLYKATMNITADQSSKYLMYCCEQELQSDILRSFPNANIATVPEKDLLDTVEKLAVKRESLLLQRIKMAGLVQSPGVPIHNYHAQLRGQENCASTRSR